MYYRRKILLSLLQVFGGELSKLDLQKYLFLFSQQDNKNFYHFVPYHYGCFSFQANQDLQTLSKYGNTINSEKKWSLKGSEDYLSKLKTNDRIDLVKFYQKYKNIKGNDLIRFVYRNAPYYAINSKIATNILNEDDLISLKKIDYSSDKTGIFTIGYEGITIEEYVNKLIKNGIKALCDVRKNPISMKYGFSKNQLKFILENTGIHYYHIPELGIESTKRQELNNYQDYFKLFEEYENVQLPKKSHSISELNELFDKHKRVALTCFEADHNYCHRSRTADYLKQAYQYNVTIIHL